MPSVTGGPFGVNVVEGGALSDLNVIGVGKLSLR